MPIRTVGIVGAGTMGRGIAGVFARAGIDVLLADTCKSTAIRAAAGVLDSMERAVVCGGLSPEERARAVGHVRPVACETDLSPADLLIEAVPEDADLKATVLHRIEPLLGHEAIIASNTSSVSITRLASALTRPDRFIGMHFFNPAPLMRLVEIVRGLRTSDATHDAVEALVVRLGKTPITVKNSPGLVVNRLLLPMLNEAFTVLGDHQAEASDIDDAMRLGCNQPMGPLTMADLIGLDVVLASMQRLHEELGDAKYRPAPLLREMVAAGYLGRKSGRGVYRY
ncbi:3-hydroxyacyl-CoA dehydrogenase NAD-binding domain-containing protein [Roseomonas sp. CCTCC AB2023176]|uniref:3-hydroxyacyl-CoA dehydrogenase NAD-binding domain-containing protein n=1 Tax=Roseomonas sp. CCTCC AB2023176 TaxID=3342640 RepID=UPI0035D91A5C